MIGADFPRDLAHASRSLFKSPASTALLVLSLALGIGATSAIFSVVEGVVLRPLPYAEVDRLGVIRVDALNHEGLVRVTASNLIDFREHSQTLESIATVGTFEAPLRYEGTTDTVPAARVSGELMPLLGIEPIYGRPLDPAIDTGPQGATAVMISEEFWERRLGRDTAALGRTLEIAEQRLEIVGVVPGGVALLLGRGSRAVEHVDLWLPLAPVLERGTILRYRALARLSPGYDFATAGAELTAIAARSHQLDGMGMEESLVYHVAPLGEHLVENVRPALLALLGAVGFVLLLVSVNVAHLLLVKAERRRREWAVRAALGADRARLAQHHFAECLILALLGGGLGLAVAALGIELMPLLDPGEVPRLSQIGVDLPVLLFTAVIAVLTAVLFGLAPAWHTARANVIESLKEGGGSASRRAWGRFLVAGELTIALVLLMGAGLMLRSFVNLHRVDLGFESADLLTFRVALQRDLAADEAARLAFNRRLVEGLGELPGVESASLANRLPLAGGSNTATYAFDAASAARFGDHAANFRRVYPRFFEAVGMPLLAGRDFIADDTDHERDVVIVGQNLAQAAWPDRDAVGQRLLIDFATPRGTTERRWADVVGVVPAIRQTDLHGRELPQAYLPFWSRTWGQEVVVRLGADPATVVPAIRDLVEELGAGRPVTRIRMMNEYVDMATRDTRFLLLLIGLFASLAVFLTGLGVYGVLAESVGQRRRELGLRMALGARRGQVARMILRDGLKLAAIGLAAGVAGALALTRVLESLLFEVAPHDPATYAGVVGLLAAIVVIASALPAWRALRVDPARALRNEG